MEQNDLTIAFLQAGGVVGTSVGKTVSKDPENAVCLAVGRLRYHPAHRPHERCHANFSFAMVREFAPVKISCTKISQSPVTFMCTLYLDW